MMVNATIKFLSRLAVYFISGAILLFLIAAGAYLTFSGFPSNWRPDHVNFVIGATASFIGSIPLLFLSYFSLTRLRKIAQLPDPEPDDPEKVCSIMLEDLSKKFVCIRFGYFETNHKNYKRIMDTCCGKDHIWDYHIHVNKQQNGEENCLEEFYELEQGVVKKTKAFNTQLFVINKTDNNYLDFISQFDLKGYSDVMITGLYKNKASKDHDGIATLSSLQLDCLEIQHIAIFYNERPLTSLLAKNKHREFFEHLVKLSISSEGCMDIIFPAIKDANDTKDIILKNGQNLYDKLYKRTKREN